MAESANPYVQTAQCGICNKFQVLRLLPCQHAMCEKCLDKILKGPSKQCSFCKMEVRDTEKGYPMYKIAINPKQDLYNLNQLKQFHHLADEAEICEKEGCMRHVDKYCTNCMKFLCYRCSRKSKCHQGSAHRARDYNAELKDTYKTMYQGWKEVRQANIDELIQEQNQLLAEIKKEIAEATVANVGEAIQEAGLKSQDIADITKKIEENRNVLDQYQSAIKSLDDKDFIKLMSQLSLDSTFCENEDSSSEKDACANEDDDLYLPSKIIPFNPIFLNKSSVKNKRPADFFQNKKNDFKLSSVNNVEKETSLKHQSNIPTKQSGEDKNDEVLPLNPTDDSLESSKEKSDSLNSTLAVSSRSSYTFGDGSLVLKNLCLDVFESDGEIFISHLGHFCIHKYRQEALCDRDDQHEQTTSACLSAQKYNNKVYALFRFGSGKREVIVYGSKYQEMRRWSVSDSKSVGHLAVSNKNVYVTNPDHDSLSVFSIYGPPETTIQHQTFQKPKFMCLCPPDSIVVTSQSSDIVSKIDCKENKVVWSSDVTKPMAVCFYEANKELWVKSYSSECIFIFDSETGELKEKILSDLRLPDGSILKQVTGMCVIENQLWVAGAYDGLLKYDINS